MQEVERLQIVERVGAVPTCEGRALSPFNSCLILYQNPTASMVGGFRQWINAGRAVRKGERGLMIWIPTAAKREGELDDSEDVRFLMGTVFDISQTDPLEVSNETE